MTDDRDEAAVSDKKSDAPQWEHELKCWPDYFEAVWSGMKTFEVRVNDRGYQAGDVIWLREYDPKKSRSEAHRYTDRAIKARIGFVLSHSPVSGVNGPTPLDHGRVVFSLLNVQQRTWLHYLDKPEDPSGPTTERSEK